MKLDGAHKRKFSLPGEPNGAGKSRTCECLLLCAAAHNYLSRPLFLPVFLILHNIMLRGIYVSYFLCDNSGALLDNTELYEAHLKNILFSRPGSRS